MVEMPTSPAPLDLSKMLSDIFSYSKMSSDVYITYYSQIHELYMYNQDKQGYIEKVYNKVMDFLNSTVAAVIEEGKGKYGEGLLIWYHKEWTRVKVCSKGLEGIFSSLNRNWIRRENDEGNERLFLNQTLVFNLWKNNLFEILGQEVISAVFDVIRRERQGETINRDLVKSIMSSIVEMDCKDEIDPITQKVVRNEQLVLYKEKFQAYLIEESKDFYKTEGSEDVSESNVMEYLDKIAKHLNEEYEWATFYLHPSTLNILTKTVEEKLFNPHIALFQTHFVSLFDRKDINSLRMMYKRCSRVRNVLDELCLALKNCIIKECIEDLEKIKMVIDKDPKAYIMTLLELYERYSQLTENIPEFKNSLEKAALVFVNKNAVSMKNDKHDETKTPEFLAKCCVRILKKGKRTLSEVEIEDELAKMIKIFTFIEDKDIFLKFYIRHLSKRLIGETSISDETEVGFITKLKDICGFEYTNRMDQMINDVYTSRDLSKAFAKQMTRHSSTAKLPEFQTLVIRSSSWPSMSSVTFCLPPEMAHTLDLFTKHYIEKHNGRKLTWALGQSKGEITANCYESQKTFLASGSQIAILLLYNESNSYSFDGLVSVTGMGTKNAALVVAALVKSGLLKGNDHFTTIGINGNEKFSLNLDYNNEKVKVDLTRFIVRPSEPKKEANNEMMFSMAEERKIVIQACIVRILKEHKTMNHQQLMAEVLKQLSTRFQPRVDSVKKCIAMLIEKEYIKRKDNDMQVYEYID